jgi:type I restriction enzyme S subunit
MAKLGECFSVIRNGASIRQTDGAGGFPITRIETIADKTINREKFGYAEIYDLAQYRDYILQDGDILMSHINSEKHLGKVALYSKQDDEQIIHGMNLLMLRADTQKVIPEYAKYYFESQKFLRQIGRITKKSVNQASFTVTALKELEIPLASIIVQRDISEKLKKVDWLISLRKQQLAKLDELVKARFVEMFGDDIYPKVKVSRVCDFITKGTTPPNNLISEKYSSDKVPYLKVYNLSFTGKLLFDTAPQYVPENIHNGVLARSKVYPNDVLMNIVGPPLGKFALVTDEFSEWNINQAIAIFRAKEKVNPKYLLFALMQPEVLKPFLRQAVGIRQLNLSLAQCRDLEIPLPPLSLQSEFAAFVEHVDEQKQTVQQSLEKLELMKKALMQEYFG